MSDYQILSLIMTVIGMVFGIINVYMISSINAMRSEMTMMSSRLQDDLKRQREITDKIWHRLDDMRDDVVTHNQLDRELGNFVRHRDVATLGNGGGATA